MIWLLLFLIRLCFGGLTGGVGGAFVGEILAYQEVNYAVFDPGSPGLVYLFYIEGFSVVGAVLGSGVGMIFGLRKTGRAKAKN